jgi:hypothetical protein
VKLCHANVIQRAPEPLAPTEEALVLRGKQHAVVNLYAIYFVLQSKRCSFVVMDSRLSVGGKKSKGNAWMAADGLGHTWPVTAIALLALIVATRVRSQSTTSPRRALASRSGALVGSSSPSASARFLSRRICRTSATGGLLALLVKEGISAHQLHRVMEITYKSAWFTAHRLREAMRSGDLAPFGGEGNIVESDETFIGRDYTKKGKGQRKGRGYAHKFKVLSLVDRTTGKARSYKVDTVDGKTIIPIVRKNIAKESVVMTDDAGHYKHLAAGFAGHEIVRHSKGEYAYGTIHIQTPLKATSRSSSVA